MRTVEWLGWAFFALNTGWKVTKSAVTYIALGVILSKFRSDCLLTLGKTWSMTVLRVSAGVVQAC